MRLVRLSLLASGAALASATWAAAADLPVRSAAPVEYVRVCSTHGMGFFYIPGSDTCLRISGRARFSYQFMSSRSDVGIRGTTKGQTGYDQSAFQSMVNINLDARTSTSYGVLRTFIRVAALYNTGGFMTSGSQQRLGQAYPALGQDTNGVAQSGVYVDKAFVQWMGFTAGRAASFFDFYAHDAEHFAATSGSNVSSTNLLAYTATFGGGWSATLSVEDPLSRRQPSYSNQTFSTTGFGATIPGGGAFTTLGGTFTQSVPIPGQVYGGAGTTGRVANYDVRQRELVPDVVGVLRYDAPWGSAQVSAAMHEIRGGALVSTQVATYGASGLLTPSGDGGNISVFNPAGIPDKIKAEMGWAVQGGLKINLPQLAAGDVLWLQAAYAEGALSYTGNPARLAGQANTTVNYSGRFAVSTYDSFIGSDFKQKLTESWSVSGAFLHYWTPEWRSAIFGSYAEVNFGQGARGGVTGPANLVINPAAVSAGAASLLGQATLKDYNVSVIGANLIWSPVKDLDIGLEGVYTRVDLKGGGVADLSKGSVVYNAASPNGLYYTGTTTPAKITKYDDLWSLRMRVQRDF